MSYHYIYLITSKQDHNKSIYKIGKTTQLPEDRFRGYEKGTEPIRIFKVDNCHVREKELIDIFNKKFKLSRGREYFLGNLKEMITIITNFCNSDEIINKICNKKNIELNNNLEEYIITEDVTNIGVKQYTNLNKGNFKCDLCNNIFISKQSLEKHMNKKNKCNIVSNFKCINCNKYFKQKKNLIDHNSKNLCNIIITKPNSNNTFNDEMYSAIKGIINSNITIQKKADYIRLICSNLSIYQILLILNNNTDIDDTIRFIILANKVNKTTKTNNITINNTNNTTNNFQINNFGNENHSHITDKYLAKLIHENSLTEDIYLKLSNKIYLDNNHPENKTIKIDNLNNNYCLIVQDNKWVTTTKDNAMKKIMNKITTVIDKFINLDNTDDENQDNYKKKITPTKIKIINEYLEKELDDKSIIEIIKNVILEIYNNYNSKNII